MTACNEAEETRAKAEGRKPELMPHVSPHICRHGFASRLYEAGIAPLLIKTVMGHESFRTDAATNTTVPFDKVQEDLAAAADRARFTTETGEKQGNTTEVWQVQAVATAFTANAQ